MRSQELDSIVENIINGNMSDACDAVEKGCKSNRYEYAARVIAVYRELICHHEGLAARFEYAVKARGDK